MAEKDYWISGELSFKREALSALNSLVLELLHKGGIRLIKTEYFKGISKEIRVLQLPEADVEGKVYFNYSKFEEKERTLSWYDTKTGVLFSEDRGYNEFGLIMNMILIAQESYSSTPCRMMYLEEEMDDIGVICYSSAVKKLTDHLLHFPNRASVTNEEIIKLETRFSLFRIMRREYNDEFLEYETDYENMSMETFIKTCKWKKTFGTLDITSWSNDDLLSCMGNALEKMEKRDKEYIPEERLLAFLINNIEDDFCKKCILLIKDEVEIDYKYFPEMSESQVDIFIIPNFFSAQRNKNLRYLMDYLLNPATKTELMTSAEEKKRVGV